MAVACENAKTGTLWLMSAHMDSDSTRKKYKETLMTLSEGIKAAPEGAVIVMSIDANDALGEISAPAALAGPFTEGKGGWKARLLVAWMIEHDFEACNTKCEGQDGPL